eukprot:SAG22_NODE_116_length_19306_cov_247.696517_6_plen_77_part_00
MSASEAVQVAANAKAKTSSIAIATAIDLRCAALRSPPGDVIDQEGAGRAAVVRPRDGPEALLAGGIPDLVVWSKKR